MKNFSSRHNYFLCLADTTNLLPGREKRWVEFLLMDKEKECVVTSAVPSLTPHGEEFDSPMYNFALEQLIFTKYHAN